MKCISCKLLMMEVHLLRSSTIAFPDIGSAGMTLVGTYNRCSIVPVHQRWLNSFRTILICTGALGLAFNFLDEKMAAILSINRFTLCIR